MSGQAYELLDYDALSAEAKRIREKLIGQLDGLDLPWEGELAILDDATLDRIQNEVAEHLAAMIEERHAALAQTAGDGQ